ncbi:MAG: deoxyribonuclease IV [Chloroflexi bacterium]|nr:MAG: deoxyribonuclease IV [Chloroflexota bacterium]
MTPASATIDAPRVGIHLPLPFGLRRAAKRAGEIGAKTVQVFVDNPTAWARRKSPPRGLAEFRASLAELDVAPIAVHASYLANLAGPDPTFRDASLDVLTADMAAAREYGASIVNVHTGSHRDTSIEEGIQRIAAGVAEVLRRGTEDTAARSPDLVLALENAAGGGWALGTTIEELAAIAERAAAMGVPDGRLGFCLDVAHAWGAGVAMDDPDAIDAWLGAFDRELGLRRLEMVHLNDSRSERGSRTDRHEHVGAGRIGARGLAHLLTHPRLRSVPFVLETPGMEAGYDAINLERCRALIAGVALDPLPLAAFQLSRRAAASGPAEDDVEAKPRRRTSRKRTTVKRTAGSNPTPRRRAPTKA